MNDTRQLCMDFFCHKKQLKELHEAVKLERDALIQEIEQSPSQEIVLGDGVTLKVEVSKRFKIDPKDEEVVKKWLEKNEVLSYIREKIDMQIWGKLLEDEWTLPPEVQVLEVKKLKVVKGKKGRDKP